MTNTMQEIMQLRLDIADLRDQIKVKEKRIRRLEDKTKIMKTEELNRRNEMIVKTLEKRYGEITEENLPNVIGKILGEGSG